MRAIVAAIAAMVIAAGCSSSPDVTASESTSTTAAVTTTAASATTAPTTTVPDTTATPTTASAPASTVPPVPVPVGLAPLVQGHNDLGADRINLIFAPWGWDDLGQFATYAASLLGFDGTAVIAGPDGWALPAGAIVDNPIDGDLGLFGFEPFRSNRHKFNVWSTEQGPAAPSDWLNTTSDPIYVPNQVIVVLAFDPAADFPGMVSHAGQDVAFRTPEDLQRTTDQPFDNVVVVVWPFRPIGSFRVTAHELGHAMFGLADEYLGRINADDFARNSFWPSCPNSLETAEEWWGDLIGEYDPMVDVWADEMRAAGLGHLVGDVEQLRDTNRTAFVDTGCFGFPSTYRSAEDTLMGFNFPAFGVTNRLWMESVLDLWTGDRP